MFVVFNIYKQNKAKPKDPLVRWNGGDKHARLERGLNSQKVGETDQPCLQVPQELVLHEPHDVKVLLKRDLKMS